MEFKDVAIVAAKSAGKYSLINFQKIKSISYKKNREITTNVDSECEAIIKKKIFQHFPGHGYLGEETGRNETDSEYTWIVDPIDGTINYARGIKLYGISIALAKGKDVILGIVYNPLTDEMYVGERNKGAFLNGKKIKASSIRDLGEAIVYLSSYDKDKDAFLKMSQAVKNARQLTSTAYDICQVAAGRIDGLIKIASNCWGFSAGCLIAEEAGAKVTNFDGSNWNTDSRKLIIANPEIYSKLEKILH